MSPPRPKAEIKENPNWTITYELVLPGTEKVLKVGTVFKVRGEKGKSYRFIKAIRNQQGDEWVDCFGGSSKHQQSRSFSFDRINPDSIKGGR